MTSEHPEGGNPSPGALPSLAAPLRGVIEPPEAVKNRPSTLGIVLVTPCAGRPALYT